MPVDDFQLSVLRSMADLRTPSSVIAGASDLHQHGWRLSNDLDIFKDPRDVAKLPRGSEGGLLVGRNGRPLSRPPRPDTAWTRRDPSLGAAWPTGPEIDTAVISRLIRRFGERGAKLWAVRENRPKKDVPSL